MFLLFNALLPWLFIPLAVPSQKGQRECSLLSSGPNEAKQTAADKLHKHPQPAIRPPSLKGAEALETRMSHQRSLLCVFLVVTKSETPKTETTLEKLRVLHEHALIDVFIKTESPPRPLPCGHYRCLRKSPHSGETPEASSCTPWRSQKLHQRLLPHLSNEE